MKVWVAQTSVLLLTMLANGVCWAGDVIPKAAWRRPIGQPLADAGTKKPTLESFHIADSGIPA